MKEATIKDFSSDDISVRLEKLFKKVNISRFADEHGLARKTLYKMRDSGVMPRGLFLDLCSEAGINPALVEFSPNERLFYFEHLSSYVKDSDVLELYGVEVGEAQERGDQELLVSISLIQKLFKSEELSFSTYLKEIKELLSKNKSVE